jgi:hypothetical protein
VATLAMLGLAGVTTPTLAHADTTAPTVASITTAVDTNSVVVNKPAGSAGYAALFVSADGPNGVTQTVQVVHGEAGYSAASSTSNAPAPGYTGVFTFAVGAAADSYNVSIVAASGYEVWAELVVFSGATGFEGAASASGTSGNTSVGLVAGSSKRLPVAGFHNWSKAKVPTVSAGFTVNTSYLNTTTQDTSAVIFGPVTSAAGTTSIGAGNWTGNKVNVSGVVAVGTP